MIVLVLLAATGRLHWLFALIASALPFLGRLLSLLRYIPILSHLYTQVQNARAARTASADVGKTGGRTSQVTSRYLRMTLHHESGEMEGEVLEGRFKGLLVSALSLEQLGALLQECQVDQESAALLHAYLDRAHGEGWQHSAGAETGPRSTPPTGEMSREEAREVLGVSPGATREEIVDAHRRLMQKLHPDRGGSTYLAAKINQAKDLLLKDR